VTSISLQSLYVDVAQQFGRLGTRDQWLEAEWRFLRTHECDGDSVTLIFSFPHFACGRAR
jgi:hypothetical protein